jgi:hypothetical protein
LWYDESIDDCVVELHISNNDIPSSKIADKLSSTFQRERAKHVVNSVPDHTNATLITIGKTLSTMACGKLEVLHSKLQNHESKEVLATLTRIIELLILNMQSVTSSVDLLDDLDTAIKTETKVFVSLRDRLAASKKAKEQGNV